MIFLSMVVGVSHDAIRRGLIQKYHWKEMLYGIACCRWLKGGYLIIDETEVNKLYSKITEGLSWIWSHKEGRFIYGYQIILICWSNRKVTIPLGWKIYKKGGKTKTELTIELIQYCLSVLRLHPDAFLFDAFYGSERILSYLKKHKQSFFTQVPKNRLFDGKALQHHEEGRPYWTKIGYLKGNIQVQVIKNRRKYYITNCIGITRKTQLGTYKIRWQIELIFRFVKTQLGLERCQSTSQRVQHNHFGCCFVTYALLQDTVQKTGLSLYRIKQKATLQCNYANQIDLSTFLSGA